VTSRFGLVSSPIAKGLDQQRHGARQAAALRACVAGRDRRISGSQEPRKRRVRFPLCSRLAERRAKMQKWRRNESRKALSVLHMEASRGPYPGRSSPRLGRRQGGPFWEGRSATASTLELPAITALEPLEMWPPRHRRRGGRRDNRYERVIPRGFGNPDRPARGSRRQRSLVDPV
jgi:hypothetical protein